MAPSVVFEVIRWRPDAPHQSSNRRMSEIVAT